MKSASFISKQVVSGEYYFLNLRPEKGAAGTVVCGGQERCDPHYRIVRNSFKFHSIEYVAAGQGELGVNGERFPLRPGAIFYYSPTTSHEIATDPAQPLDKYFVDFCGPRFTRLLKRHPLASHEPCYLGSAPRIREIFADLQQSGRNTGPHTQGICACLLDQIPTLKRVFVERRDDSRLIVLRGDNPDVPPVVVDDARAFSIQGVVTHLVDRAL